MPNLFDVRREPDLKVELATEILEHICAYDALIDEMFAQSFDDLHLLLGSQARYGKFNDAAYGSLVHCDEARLHQSLSLYESLEDVIFRDESKTMDSPLVIHE